MSARICEDALVALAGLGPQHSDLDVILAALLPHLTYGWRVKLWLPIADAEQARRISGQVPPRGDAEQAYRAEQDAAQQVRDACALAAGADQRAAGRSYPTGVR